MTDSSAHRSQWDAYDELWTPTRRCTPRVSKEIVSYMTRFQQNAPGGHFVTEVFLDHHDRSLARWTMTLGPHHLGGAATAWSWGDGSP